MVEDACWRKVLEVGVRASTSMGMLRRAEAKIAFIKGMYWCGEAGLAERTRILLCKAVGAVKALLVITAGFVDRSGVSSTMSLFACASASVIAPARAVVELLSADGGVFANSFRRASFKDEAMVANGL